MAIAVKEAEAIVYWPKHEIHDVDGLPIDRCEADTSPTSFEQCDALALTCLHTDGDETDILLCWKHTPKQSEAVRYVYR